MSQPDIIATWIAAEAEAKPDCEVLAAIKVATNSNSLDEAALLLQLRLLCEPTAKKEDSDAAG